MKGTESLPQTLIFLIPTSLYVVDLSLKYNKFTPPGCKDIGTIKLEFEAKTQFFWLINYIVRKS